MMRKTHLVSLVVLSAGLALPAQVQAREAKHPPIDPAGVARLAAETGAQVSISDATGAARFVRMAPNRRAGSLLQQSQAPRRAPEASAAEFFRAHGSIFGLRDQGAELRTAGVRTDRQGFTHITHKQFYRGVPVLGGELKSHVDAAGDVVAVSGTFIPEIALDTTPRHTADEAGRTARAWVEAQKGGSLSARSTTLMVFREGLAKGVPGPNRLAWQVEVGDGAGVREFVYIDARTGKFIDQISGVQDSLFRRAYDGQNLPAVPPEYPGTPFWSEGDPFPTAVAEADNMILSSKDTYDFYSNAFGRDSFDGAGATMDSIFNRGYSCPNASWNGTFISFCPGLTSDDVTGHEWTHAYTQYTHGLIYQWQPGALNESYSDIFGETIDRINNRGGDTPDNPRTADTCSAINGGTPPPTLTITGGSAAGSYLARASVNEPTPPFTVGPTPMALSVPAGACTAVSGVSGKIAIVDWTLLPGGANECGSGTRAANALAAGAAGIIFVAPASGLLNLGSSPLIASVEITNADGATIKAGLPADATIAFTVGTDNSVRWLLGEDDTGALPFALRDMWNPRCFGNPGKVSDSFEYTCSTADQGGVHTNSGVPNHGYALLVDGGNYNGQSVVGIGLTKAAHIYFRAMTAYQGPASDFADHADAIEQSCTDLLGVDLNDLSTGAPSGQVITAFDCAQVAAAAAAVELRTPPSACNFQPVLAQNPPDRCEAGTSQATIFTEDFETNPAGSWSVASVGSNPEFTPRDWQWTSSLPGNRPGSAMFGIDFPGGTCGPGGDESGVLQLTSPVINLPAGASNPLLTFDHWVATEGGWDGGNLKISVNGGPWQVVAPADYTYNGYNAALFTAAQGNTNPLAGEPAFTGTDGGSVGGSWGRSHVNLTNYAMAGDAIQLRYDIGNDGCTGITGWYVDDPTVYACVPSDTPSLSIDDVEVIEGNSGFTDANFRVSLSHASAKKVSTWYITAFGTAWPLLDYLPELNKLQFAPLELERNISIRVRGEKLFENDETFFVHLFNSRNATILDGKGKGTILNDDRPRHPHRH
jgi:Zn-dependent metalloprotease